VGCEGRPGLLWTLVSSLPGRMLALVGTWSYSIYLWQFFAKDWAVRFSLAHFAGLAPSPRYLAATCLYLSLAVILGMVMNKLIEAPMLALRERVTWMRGKREGARASTTPLLPVIGCSQQEV